MPFRRRGFSGRRRGLGQIIDSNKNIVHIISAGADATKVDVDIVDTQDSATLAVADDVTRGCTIKAVWVELWVTAAAAVAAGITNTWTGYIIKNPGANLTTPSPTTEGTSNEKKFIIKTWKGLIGTRVEGYMGYSWKGWVKIPRGYQRFGANDKLQFVHLSNGVAALACILFIYKWYK